MEQMRTPRTKKKLENSMDELKLNLTELAEGTTYYYKAYATNSKGTSYGEVLNFTTLPNIEFSNVSVSNITPTTASVVYSISLAGKNNYGNRSRIFHTI